jgi:uncharacterized protein (TIGR02757 family)
MSGDEHRRVLEALYRRYNWREYVHPDPLEFLYAYGDVRDREVAGLVAASLAVGRVRYILRSVSAVLDRLTDRPARFLDGAGSDALRRRLAGIRHRYLTGENVAAMLWGARALMKRHGSLGAFFAGAMRKDDETVLPALGILADRLRAGDGGCGRLVSHPCGGSACKRFNLLLRWMVRSDAVDPGGWRGVSASRLVVPLDTHMLALSQAMGLTRRRNASLATALEVTAAFRGICPQDPVRYDFALTRLGIRPDADGESFLAAWRAAGQASGATSRL